MVQRQADIARAASLLETLAEALQLQARAGMLANPTGDPLPLSIEAAALADAPRGASKHTRSVTPKREHFYRDVICQEAASQTPHAEPEHHVLPISLSAEPNGWPENYDIVLL